MALSSGFKRARKFRTLKSRRLEVIGFWVIALIGITIGSLAPLNFLFFFTYPLFRIFGGGPYMSWDYRRRVIPLSTLDDRAMAKYGKLFDHATPAEQNGILNGYRGETVLQNYLPDEREYVQRAAAHMRAYQLLPWILPVVLLVCWAMKAWKPHAYVLVLIFWTVMVVLGLPQMILLWTEPEDVNEMRLAEPMGREA